MLSDYTGKFFIAGLGKCSGEPCQLLLKSGVSQVISLCMSFESTTSLTNAEYVFRGHAECLGPS